ncbi:hypothetical protein [Thermodesulfovibrio yellowstonii]|uniref:hypothetical protein n=1 Tax=Thermodesulfovibrio yellowstonii TaxID=28262 RepID=UPI0003FE0A49|nr:hypothetical protein [Thermodesulfovibrio islandicus]
MTENSEVKQQQPQAEQKGTETEKKRKGFFFISLLISVVVSAASIFVYDHFFAQKIVIFDLKGYVATLRDLYLAGKINDEELKKGIDEIEKVVNSTPKRKVIITSDVVLGGNRVENITPIRTYPQVSQQGLQQTQQGK